MIQQIKNFNKLFPQSKIQIFIIFILIVITIFISSKLEIKNISIKEKESSSSKLIYFEKFRLNKLEINFGKKTTRHFLVLGQLIEQGKIKKYNELNTWKKVKLNYKGEKFSARIKLHGKNPNGHSNGFIFHSYSVKLEKGSSINGFRKFKLIIDDRFEGSQEILAISKITNVFSIPIYPIKVIFNEKHFSEYALVPRIDEKFSDKIGYGTMKFFKEHEKKNIDIFKENDLKSFLFNPYAADFEANEEHIEFLEKKLSETLIENYRFSNQLNQQIVKRFRELNIVLYKNNHENILKYFDTDYIINYLLTLIISAENGHQNVYANQQIAYDVATGYFYPFLTWDAQKDLKKYYNSENIFESMKNYSENTPIPLMINLLNNNQIKMKLKKRIPIFIRELKEKNLIDQNLYNKINKKNYFDQLVANIDNIKSNNVILDSDSLLKFKKKSLIKKIGYFKDKTFIFNKGIHKINENLLFPKNIKVEINSGTELILNSLNSIIINGSLHINGDFNTPVSISSDNLNNVFGVFAVIGNRDDEVLINNLNISNASEAIIDGKYLSGGISLYNFKNIEINNLNILNAQGEDGLNIKYVNQCNLKNIFIKDSKFDSIDIDKCEASLKDITLENSNDKDMNGDGIDFYSSKAILENLDVSGFNDKGLSIGENSIVTISNSFIYNNIIGSAIKDSSCLIYDTGNLFKNNKVDISIYNKKSSYRSGTLVVNDILDLNIEKDKEGKVLNKEDILPCQCLNN